MSSPDRAAVYMRFDPDQGAGPNVDSRVLSALADTLGLAPTGVWFEYGLDWDMTPGRRTAWRDMMARIDDWDVLLVMRLSAISSRADEVEAVRAWLGERGRRLEWPSWPPRRPNTPRPPRR